MKISIAVAAHKSYRMPEDDCYLPLHVGCEGKQSIGFTGDNTGDNISVKNATFCELTGLYWMWKNSDADYIGLAHYRRHFAGKSNPKGDNTPFARVIGGAELEDILKNIDIIVPKKRRYYIETLYSHYAHSHYAEHLDVAREIISRQCPEYLPAFDKVMKRTYGHMFNMFVMKRDKCDAYCGWLFSILNELETKVDTSDYSAFQARLFGRVSELLLDVWLEKNGFGYKEIPVINMEKLNWGKKIKSFIMARVFHKKYEGSF